jgi:hypothetical protein
MRDGDRIEIDRIRETMTESDLPTIVFLAAASNFSSIA